MSRRRQKQKFEIGDCVETSKGEKCLIHYIGPVNGLSNNILYGIEYIDGTIGEHNGKYKGKKYFIGLPKRCSFIKYNQIRRKTKYYNKNSSKSSLKKTNSVKKKSMKKNRYPKSARNMHSNNIFTTKYAHKYNPQTKKTTSKLLNSKRKSLPTQLNDSNDKKKLKNRTFPRRASASSKNKNKYLLHLDDLKLKNNKIAKKKHKKQDKPQPSQHNRRKNAVFRAKKQNKIRSTSVHNTLEESNTKKPKFINTKSTVQKSRKNGKHRSQSIGAKQGTKKGVKKEKNMLTLDINIEECSKYKHERIHFSQMDMLDLLNGNSLGLKTNTVSEIIASGGDIPILESSDSKRKNAFSNIILSQDSLNEYHLSRNLLIGDIHIGHKYLLKNGKYGICLYVGPMHWINNGKISVDNEYIGIALDTQDGRHDGEFKGKRYFQCKSRCGLFMKRNKLLKDCGPVDQEEIDRITKKKRKRGGLLYDFDSDISDLSDLSPSDSDFTHSGHSDFDDNICDYDMDHIKSDDDSVSYIDLFSPQTQNNVMSPIDMEYENIKTPNQNENELNQKLKRLKIKTKPRQLQTICMSDSQCRKSSNNSLKLQHKKSQTKKFGCKKRKNSKKLQSQTPKVGKNVKTEKKSKIKKENDISTKFPFIFDNDNQNNASDEYFIKYKPVLTKKRCRRNATPIVSIPNLIGKQNFLQLINQSNDFNINDDRNHFSINFNSKSLTPLPSQHV